MLHIPVWWGPGLALLHIAPNYNTSDTDMGKNEAAEQTAHLIRTHCLITHTCFFWLWPQSKETHPDRLSEWMPLSLCQHFSLKFSPLFLQLPPGSRVSICSLNYCLLSRKEGNWSAFSGVRFRPSRYCSSPSILKVKGKASTWWVCCSCVVQSNIYSMMVTSFLLSTILFTNATHRKLFFFSNSVTEDAH